MKSSEHIERLLSAAGQGDLDFEGGGELLAACREDPEVLVRLSALIETERLIGRALAVDGGEFSREASRRIEIGGELLAGEEFAGSVTRRLKRRRLKSAKVIRFAMAAAAAIAMIAIPALLLLRGTGTGAVAEIMRVEATDWQVTANGLKAGQRINIEQGLVELHYFSGVRLMIEAPAEYEITGRNSGYLHRGRLVAEIDDERARGFTIDGASGRLIDLGTKFGVAVDDEGAMEVHVLEGIVDAQVTGGTTERLVEDQARRLAGGRVSHLKADPGKFITQIPVYQNQPPRFVRWSFDDDGDPATAKNTGRNLATEGADASFRSFSGTGSVPQRIADAPYGKAARFDGKDGFLESGYHGIEGGRPRTVAFWVRVPKDSAKSEGFGIINWGNYSKRGGAWQISVNPRNYEGPLGGLRIGTNQGEMIGTTDLRDSVWHHCAVVMYGDEDGQPNTSTHVLLYLDGQLEPTGRKSVRVIDTSIGEEHGREDHGIWMGRNLAFNPTGKSDRSYSKFFRGDIDEMIICDMALNQKQILRLMEENAMP